MAKTTLHALDYLNASKSATVPPVCVVFGDEPLLKRESVARLRSVVLGEGEGEFSFRAFVGKEAEPRDVFDALSTLSLFGSSQQFVMIEAADEFVRRYRKNLEDYVDQPSPSGVLVLDVSTWPKGTKLYKKLSESGLQIECSMPTESKLRSWLPRRAQSAHSARLEPGAVDRLLEMVDPNLGLIDQELGRLALLAGTDGAITEQLVQDTVGTWRTRSTWDLIDTAAAGQASEALKQLDRLLLAGEQPIAILAQMASTFRRFATAARLVESAEKARKKIPLRSALEQAGFPRFTLKKAEPQLRQIGRVRAKQLLQWFLSADLALKGESSSPARARGVLEQLIVRVSKAADPRQSSASPK